MDLPVRRLWFIIIILHLWVTRLVWPENHQTNWDWGETIGWYHLVPPFFSHRWILYGQISSIRKKSHQDHQISRCLAGKPPAYQPQAGYLTILLSTLGCHPSLQSFSKHPHGLWNWGPGETGETHVVTPKSTPIFEAKSMRIKWRVWFICLYGLHYILGVMVHHRTTLWVDAWILCWRISWFRGETPHRWGPFHFHRTIDPPHPDTAAIWVWHILGRRVHRVVEAVLDYQRLMRFDPKLMPFDASVL